MASIDASRVRALAESLIAIPSVSPDVRGETACAALLSAELPAGAESGTWVLADGRPVVWARVPGRSRRVLLMLGHYDTVGVDEFAPLGAAAGSSIAFDPPRLRERLLTLPRATLPPDVAGDLAAERAAPGRWLFGRGALDMKSGLAAGIAAIGALAEARTPPAGDVWFVVTPDEEHQSAGMLAAVPQLARAFERGAWVGALNLDYVERPEAYTGVTGKARVGLYVRGVPTHVGSPFTGVDAIQLAAAAVRRITTSAACTDAWQGVRAAPPVALALRDLKPAYNVQTALEAVAELNMLSLARPIETMFDTLERELRIAMDELMSEMRALSGSSLAWRVEPVVRTLPQLGAERAPSAAFAGAHDLEAATLDHVRAALQGSGIEGPAIVLYLLPPFYPASAPGDGPLARAAAHVLPRYDLPLRPFYPYISDASYVAWRGEDQAALERHLPALGCGYALPIDAMRALDLDVVNVGPWGRDAHGRFERVDTKHAFEVLPQVLIDLMGGAFEG